MSMEMKDVSQEETTANKTATNESATNETFKNETFKNETFKNETFKNETTANETTANATVTNRGASNQGKTANFTQTIVTERTSTQIKKPSLYHVIMLNDDFTPMEFVVWVLKVYFDKEQMEAEQLMLQVHNGSRAVVGTYIYDIANTKCNAVIKEAREQGFPFQVVVEKAE